MRLWIDKIASSTRNVGVKRDARLTDKIIAREGTVIAGRICGEKSTYNVIEDVYGRLVPLHDGDVIAGVLGPRQALHGYAGYVPEAISVGDRLQLLNMGGVIGRCTSQNPDVGPPFDVEVLGGVLIFPEFENRAGVPGVITTNAIRASAADVATPIVFVAGTCMNSGKTFASCQVIRQLAQRGFAVGGCKLTGVSLRRDTLQMLDYGANWAFSFNDAGTVTTSRANAPGVAKTLLAHLQSCGADVIVAELGDGILGEYGVAEILKEPALRPASRILVMCANDPVGVWGAQRVLQEDFGLEISVVSGPATDNAVGVRYVEDKLGLRAINARTNGHELGDYVAELASKQIRARSA